MQRAAATEGEERPPFFLSTIFFLQLQLARQGQEGGQSPCLMKLSFWSLWTVECEQGDKASLLSACTAYIAPVAAALRPLLALVTLCHPSPATSPGYRLQHPTVDHSRPGALHRRERTVLSAWPEVAWRPNKPTNQNYWSSPSSNCVKGDINSKRVVPANLKNVAGIWNLWNELRFRLCLVGENFWISVP